MGVIYSKRVLPLKSINFLAENILQVFLILIFYGKQIFFLPWNLNPLKYLEHWHLQNLIRLKNQEKHVKNENDKKTKQNKQKKKKKKKKI